MKQFIVESWFSVMNHQVSPLKNIPDLQVRHVVLQILAWMWCIIFSMSVGSIAVFGITAIAHALLIAGVVMTVGTFEMARRKTHIYGLNGTSTGSDQD